MSAIDRLREKLIAMGCTKLHVSHSEHPATPEEIAEELLQMLEAIEQGKYKELRFNDSKRK